MRGTSTKSVVSLCIVSYLLLLAGNPIRANDEEGDGTAPSVAAEKAPEESLTLESDLGWTRERQWWIWDVNPVAQARQNQQEGDYKGAAKAYGNLAESAQSATNAARCYIRQGDANMAAERYKEAAQAYQRAQKEAPHLRADDILKKLRDIARRLAADPDSFFRGPDIKGAISVLEYLTQTAPYGSKVRHEMLRLAELYRKEGRYEEAKATYNELISRFPDTEESAIAHLQLADVLYGESKRTSGTGNLLLRARQHLDMYRQSRRPDSPGEKEAEELLTDIQRLEAERLLQRGRFYTWPAHYRPEVAEDYLSRIVNEYEKTPQADKATRLLKKVEKKQQ